MYLAISLDDGSTVDVSVTGTHSLRVIDASGNTQDSFAFGNVTDMKLMQGDVPAAAPVEPVVDTSEPAGTPSEPTTVAVSPVGDVVQGVDGPAPASDVTAPPITEPVDVDGTEPAEPVADPATQVSEPAPDPTVGDATSEPGTPAPAPVDVPDSEHDQAVDTAQAAVEAVATAPDAAPEDKLAVLTDAQTDVDAALAQWPDSPALLDAKAKLVELAADLATSEAA